MTLLEEISSKLEYHYGISQMKPHHVTVNGHNIYQASFDDRFLNFIDDSFKISKTLFYQMKFLTDFINMVSKNKLHEYSSEIIIGKTTDIVVVLFGDSFSINIRKDDTLENFSMKFFEINIHFDKDKKIFDYEYYFKNRKLDLCHLLQGFTSFKQVSKIFDNSMTHRIHSVLNNSDVTILSKSEFVALINKELNFTFCSNPSLNFFDLKRIIPNILSKNSYQKLNQLLTLLFFEFKLDNDSFNYNNDIFECEVVRTDSKFHCYYELYRFTFARDVSSDISQYLSITTESTIFEYYASDKFDSFAPITAKGFENIYNLLKDRILDKIANKLSVDTKDINNNSLILYSMVSI